MSAEKDTITKIPVDVNVDSGFLSGPIDSLNSGDLGVPSDRISETVKSGSNQENVDSGLDLCSQSISNLNLDDTPTQSQSTRLRDTQDTSTLPFPPLNVLFQQDEDGDTILHLSAVHGCEKSVGILIKMCTADKTLLDIANDYRHTALHLAVMSGYSVVTRMLVRAGASLAVRDVQGRTPVHIAAETGHELCLKALLGPVNNKPQKNLASILNQKDYNGQMAVHVAANAGHVKILQTLSYYGADINAAEGLAGWTVLHIAARRGDERAVQWAVGAGAECGARDCGGRTARRLAPPSLRPALSPPSAHSDSSSDSEYDSEGESLFEKLVSMSSPINVA